ncbi:MAG: hypothetical protein GX817_01130, partial [Elusimicrobia bacterium]|nr:hypothetical protein [Elusimicrobiota bacterium]
LRTVDYLRRAVESDPLLGLRIKGMGVLTSDIIRQYGISGPAARASGLDIDIRKDEPYSLYSNLNFSVPVRSEGDIYARLLIRIEEIFESASIVGACLTMLKRVNSPLFTQLDKMPKGEGIGRTESPEGEFFHYIRTRGGNVPFRHKVRPPSYMISPVVEKIFKYCGIENYPLILISLDPAYSYFSGLIAEVGNFENPTEISESGFSDSTKKKSKYFVPGRK